MKKLFSLLSLSFIFGCGLGLVVDNTSYFLKPISKRDFEFRCGFSYVCGNYDISTTHVIVNNSTYPVEEMLEMVKNQYVKMNGEPEELTINLYDSLESLKISDPYYSKTYIK